MVDSLKILQSSVFYEALDQLVKEKNLTYIDAIVFYCERNGIEIETAAALIKSNPRIKSSLQIEGEDLNFLPRSSRLPI